MAPRAPGFSPPRGRVPRIPRRNQPPSPPALTLFYALEVQVKSITAEGLEARWTRHKAMAARTQDWVAKISDETGRKLANIAPLGSQSPTVSAIRLPADLPAETFTAAVGKRSEERRVGKECRSRWSPY